MLSPTQDPMTPDERRAGASLAAIFSLRMLGLFLILPVFSVHAHSLPGGDNALLIGLTLGAYGVTQAFFQIPWGIASDRWGRKPVIAAGLTLFAAGCVIAALADSVLGILVGRVIQGAGAISAAVTALAADLTREQHRTKVMAMIGSSIGLVFALALVAAPPMYAAIGMSGMFYLTAVLALLGIGLLYKTVPAAPDIPRGHSPHFLEVLRHPGLMRLNIGIFVLHFCMMAIFVVIPPLLVQAGLPMPHHWKVYLPAVLISFTVMVPAIIAAERHGKMKPVFLMAVGLLILSEAGFGSSSSSVWGMAAFMVVFFIAFNILEATLPSLVSRMAPPGAKGAALGIYNTTQAVGLFSGGGLAGAVSVAWGPAGVFILCATLTLIWMGVIFTSQFPARPAPAHP